MADPNTAFRPTIFPRLDTLSADSRQPRSAYRRRDFNYADDTIAQPAGKNALLHAYSRFIACFTGEAEVCYHFALRTCSSARPHTVQAVVAGNVGSTHSDADNISSSAIDTSVAADDDDAHYDFGLEIFADPDQFDTLTFPPILHSPFIVQYHATRQTLVLLYDGALLDDSYADVVWHRLVQQLSGNDYPGCATASHLSVLNHPPLQHPPPLSLGDGGNLPPRLLHAGFQMSAARWYDRHALHFRSISSENMPVDEILTYGQLECLTTALAMRLCETIPNRAEGPVIVPAFMSNCVAFYVSWLAVLKAGFAFCPLPIDAPSEQLRGIVEEIGASVILTKGPHVGGKPWDAWYCDGDELATCLDVKAFIDEFGSCTENTMQCLPQIDKAGLAYVMYTSGSTGRPKGVKISHFSAACSIASHAKYIPVSFLRDGFRWFQFAAPTFDPSIMEIFTTWWTGGTLCGAPRELLLSDPEDVINQFSANIMMATPSMASVLRPEKVPSLRHLWTMGEKLIPKVIKNFSSNSPSNTSADSHTPRLHSPRKLLNAYGPTEGSINCNIVANFSHDERGSIIGQPIDTCSVLVIDPEQREPTPMPLSFSGELAIGGPQVSEGYLNRPEQTAAAFVTSAKYGRLYRTGDRARVVKMKTGEHIVEFLGRLTTDQVKLSGRRVELGQIESTIAAVAGVTDVVAIVHQHGAVDQGSEQIMACIATDGSRADDELIADARKAAEVSLARFMLPARYFVLRSMPRSRSGKTDRKALSAYINEKWEVSSDGSRRSSDSGYDTGMAQSVNDTATLATVVELIAELCNVSVEHITPGTQLLSLGLDSLRAVRLLQQLRDRDISHLNVASVLSSRTVAGLANDCARGESATPERYEAAQTDWDARFTAFSSRHIDACAEQLSIDVNDVDRVLPTTATQSGMIASYLRSVSKQATRKRYINHSIYYPTSGIDTHKLSQAWVIALGRPDILRVVFAPVDDEFAPFAQCVLSSTSDFAHLRIQQYRCNSPADWDSTVAQAQAEAEASINLSQSSFKLSIIRSTDCTAYLLSLFHGIFDGGSLELILQDVEDAYHGREPKVRTQLDVSVRKHFTEATEESARYWRDDLAGFEHIPFPCVSASKPETQSADAQVTEIIGESTLDKLSEAAKAMSVSPLSLLQAAWATILFAYTGSTTDVSFGSVVSDRVEEELSSCAAPTFAVVPTRLGRSDGTTKDVLSLLTSRNADALSYHHLPLSSLTTAEGTLPYDTLLAFQAFDKSAGNSRLWSKVEYPAMEHDFAVMIEMWPMPSGSLRLRGTWTYNHLDSRAAETMLRQLDGIVGFLCETPDSPFMQAQFAVSRELQSQIPIALKPAQQRPDTELFLHRAFVKHAAIQPKATALIFRNAVDGSLPDTCWSYEKLYSLAKSFALDLQKLHGPFRNEPIMICMEKCAELYVAILGVLLAGAGWSPIDPYSPPARQHAIMERTGSRLLLISPTASDVAREAVPSGVSTVLVDLATIEQGIPAASEHELHIEGHPDDLAYLIFTSGTTGLPKGVPISHRAGATAMNALAKSIPSDVSGGVVRCMQFSQYTFDVFVQDLFYTWTLGGTVISSNRQNMIQNFADIANDLRATHAHLTPAFSATLARSTLKTLEVVTMIGEKLTEAVASDWGTNMRAFNTYGPAEVTVVSTLRQFTGKDDPYHSSNVGVPLESVGTYVVDSNNNIVMRGAIGELALSGPQLSRGYWKLPEVNAKKFIWNDQLQEKLYLTGDLVRHLADGTLDFVGRNDDLVKLGGIRVELGEIAFALKDADHRIENFEVLHCKRKDAEEKLVVAFMACPSLEAGSGHDQAITTPAAKELAHIAGEYGRKVLPPYMLPSTFVVLPHIPRTASAKVDRAAMTAIYHALDLAAWVGAEERAGTDLEDKHATWRQSNENLLQIIANALNCPLISLHPASSLPAIGIDSIGAIKLIPKINALGYKLAVVDAFRCRTLADLCDLANASAGPVETTLDANSDRFLQSFDATYYNAVSAFVEQDDIIVVPTTVLQESLLSESFKDAQAYWSSHLFELDATVDLGKLKRAWVKVARQTEVLRAGFVAKAMLSLPEQVQSKDNLSYLQVIYDEPVLSWMEHNIKDSVTSAAKDRVAHIARYHHQQLFKLPPWAVNIFCRESGSSVMMITIHHSIYDGPSLSFIEEDLRSAYQRGPKRQHRLQLTEAIVSKSATDADNKEVVDFWKIVLQDIDLSSGAHIVPEEGSTKLHHRIQHLRSSTPFSTLQDAAKKVGLASVVTFYRVAWALVLSDILETAHVLFAEILSDRIVDRKFEDVTGPMMSTVPNLFVRRETVKATLIEQDRFAKQAWLHRNIRPGTIRALLNRSSSSQVFPAVFAFHPAASDDTAAQLWHRLDDVTQIEVEHPWALNVWQDSEERPKFELAVADHLMREDEQQLLLLQLDALVGSMVDNSDSSLSALTETFDTALISRTTPRTDTNCPSPYSPTHYVEHFAQTHPHWKGAEIALKIDHDETKTVSWTYAELNAESNRVAHWILQQGISKRRIGMCLGRTLTSYAILLGIMKSGNCYLPIDDSLPAERKSFLLDDSDAAMIFATGDVFEGVKVPMSCRLVDPENERVKDSMRLMSPHNPHIDSTPCDDCYLLYTSGSTGKPKGVLVNRGNLASFVEAQSEFICDVTRTKEVAGRGKYMGLASRAFDVHLGEAFLAWRHGLTALTAPRSMLLDDLALALSSLHVTHASAVPSLLDQTGLTPEDAPDLVFFGVGGEKMSAKTKKLWGGHDRVGLINAYGPTEATIGCCSNHLRPDSNVNDIGIPLGDSQAHILVPGTDHYTLRGMPGELCFTGSLIANGYLNRPDAKGFVDDFHGQRMYRTGDIVKLGLDDHIYFLGRKDDQVKIRGQRVELGEVAEGVRTASDIPIDVTALVVQHPQLSRQQLVAFVAKAKSSKQRSKDPAEIIASDLQETSSRLRAECQKILPSSTVPDLIVPVTYIPLAPTSGKADNKLLLKMFSDVPISDLMPHGANGRERNNATDRPMSDAEQAIWKIVSSVLKEKPCNVGPGSTVFELGIDSLSGISVFSKLRAAGYDCSVAMVMKNPTIEQLARCGIQQTQDDAEQIKTVRRGLADIEHKFFESGEVGIALQDVASVRPCLPLQEVLVAQSMHQSLDGSGGAYVNHRRFELGPGLDIDRLKAAWARVVRDNDILRTCFSTQADDFLQIVMKPEAIYLQWSETRLTSESKLHEFQRQVGTDIVSKLSTKPPMRLHRVKLPRNKDLFVVSIHHAIYDGNSLEMIMRDVQSFYEGTLPTPRPSMAPLIEYLAGQDKDQQKQHWSTLLQDWEQAPLLSNDAAKFVTLQESERRFSRKLSELDRSVSALNVTFATLLQFAFATALAQTTQTNDFIYGNVLSGRTVPVEGVDSMMAPCITTIPSRIKLEDAQQSVADALAALQMANSSSLEHQHVSPRDIQKWTGADRALYDCLFSFIRLQDTKTTAKPFLKEHGSDIGVDYPLAVEFEANPAEDCLTIRAGFTEAFGDSSQAVLLLEKIEILVDVIIQQKDLTVGSLGIPTHGSKRVATTRPKYDENRWSSMEQQIRNLLSQFTHVPEEDIHKDTAFIHMGIDSISAIRFARHLRAQGIKVSSADVVRHNRLGALCEYISSSQKQPSNPETSETISSTQHDLLSVLKSHGVKGLDAGVQCYEATPLQSGMLAQSQATDGALYMHHHATRCDPAIDIDRLRAAWHSLVTDLDILRTTFHYLPTYRAPWLAVVHQHREAEWHEVVVEDAHQHWLELSQKSDFLQRIEQRRPLASAEVVRSEDGPVLILSLHHAVYDGISLAMLYRHLAIRYHAETKPTIVPFYEAARTIVQTAETAANFWADQVQGYSGMPATTNSETPTFTLSELTVADDMVEINIKCRKTDLDIKDICVAGFGKALATLYGRRDVVFGQVMAARHSADGDGNEVIGPMFNTVPIRVAIKDQLMTNNDVVQAVHAVNAGSLEYQHASLAEIQKRWRSTVSDPSAQLIDSIFVYSRIQKQVQQGLEIFGQPLQADKSPVPSEYRLNFEVEHTEEGIVARALSSLDSIEVDLLLEHYKGAVHDILNQPGRFATAYPEQLRALPAEAKSAGTITNSFDQTAVERFAGIIRAAMAEVAQVQDESIALDSSIYSFGIDSIAAIQIVSRCRQAGLRLSVADILKGAMLGRICEIVAARNDLSANATTKSSITAALISPEERTTALLNLSLAEDAIEEVLPCLPGQEYHLLSWLQSGRTLYEPGWCYRARSRLDSDRMKNAWSTLRKRNAVLRTTFTAVQRQRPLQVVIKHEAITDEAFVVLADAKNAGVPVEDAVKAQAHIEARKPSDFFRLPVRLRLIQGADGDAVMLYVHHSLYDAWSMPRLVSEIVALYNGTELEQGPPFSDLVRHTLTSIDQAEEQHFWRDNLSGCETSLIPSSHQPKDELNRRQAFLLTEGTLVAVADLEDLCATHKISPHHLVLLAFARALAKITNTNSPLFGFFQLGRSAAFDNIDRVTGPCVNALPLGLRDVLRNDVLQSVHDIQRVLGERVRFEQSSLRTAIEGWDSEAKQLPFNAHINLLWNKSSLIGSTGDEDLFHPMKIGVPTDYSSPEAILGRTAVDGLETGLLPEHQIFLDVGPGEKGIVFGARADSALMDRDGIREFIDRVEREVVECMERLK